MSNSDSDSSEPTLTPEPTFETTQGPPSLAETQGPPSLADTMSTTASQVTVNGRTIKVRTAAKTLVESQGEILYPKSLRDGLKTLNKLSDLYEKACKQHHTKYELMSLSLSDEEKLDDTYNLELLIRKTREAHMTYDMHDVFTIVILDSSGMPSTSKDLYSQYSDITIQQVADSNRWYKEWTEDDEFAGDNLNVTYNFMKNNVSDSLWEKTFEKYDQYSASERGGPLFFILMLNVLLSNTAEAARTLETRVKNFKITSLRGEDIDRAVSLLRGALKRLNHIKKADATWKEDMTITILKVLQTTSVDKFNAIFEGIERERLVNEVLQQTGQKTAYNFEALFSLAGVAYRVHCEQETWTGVSTTGHSNGSVFQAGASDSSSNTFKKKDPTCWNCGDKHMLSDCKKPKSEARIEQNKNKMYDNVKKKRAEKADQKKQPGKDKSKKNKTKFAPPAPNEQNRRVINGKNHLFNSGTKRWDVETANVVAATAATAAAPSTPAPSATPSAPDSDRSRNVEVAVANASQAMTAALQGLALQFN
jgi:hypothetical protein